MNLRQAGDGFARPESRKYRLPWAASTVHRVPSKRASGWIWAGAAAAAISGLLWLLLAGGDDPQSPGAGLETTGGESSPVEPDAGTGAAGSPTRPPREPKPVEPRSQERVDRLAASDAQRAYRDYVAAINDRNGDRLCKLIAPGFERALRPPADSGSCGARISSSIGFADERGFPVWEQTTLSDFESALIGEALSVQVTATIVTRFRDREQPSIESDVAYLRPVDGRFQLVKASAALWRAVGKPDVPPEVIAPPPGF